MKDFNPPPVPSQFPDELSTEDFDDLFEDDFLSEYDPYDSKLDNEANITKRILIITIVTILIVVLSGMYLILMISNTNNSAQPDFETIQLNYQQCMNGITIEREARHDLCIEWALRNE